MRKTDKELLEMLQKRDFQKIINALAKKYAGKKILAYGAGQFADIVLDNYDLSKMDIIGFSDNKFLYSQTDYRNFKTYSPEKIAEVNPDIILLFVYDDIVIKEYFKDYYPALKTPLVHIMNRNFIEKMKFLIYEAN